MQLGPLETDIYSGTDVVWAPGDKVEQYTLGRPLARGGMAELHLATADGLDEPVVLKRVRRDYADRSDVYVLFEREAALAAALDHPNIVKVLEVLEADGDPVIVMEYLRGWDLRRILKVLFEAKRRMPLDVAVYVVQQALRGLAYAHTMKDASGRVLGVVHRDVSPSNVFVTTKGEVKLLDFGIAKLEQATPTTLGASPKGKRAYMSPEQCRGTEVDCRADLFAIAAVLYELTTMRRAFDGRNDMAILLAILSKTPPAPDELVDGFPPDLSRLIMRGLAQKVEDRYDSAAKMNEDLVEVAEAQGLHASPQTLARLLGELGELEREQLKSAGARSMRRPEEATQGTSSNTSPSGQVAPTGFGGPSPESESGSDIEGLLAVASGSDRAGSETPDPDSSASVSAAPVVATATPPRRLWPLMGIGIVAGAIAVASLWGRGEAASPIPATNATAEPEPEPAVDADPSSPEPTPEPIPEPTREPTPPSVDDDLAKLGDPATAEALGYDGRRELVMRVTAQGRAETLDAASLLELDLAQAAGASSPCAAAHAGIQRAMATDDAIWVDPVRRMVVAVDEQTDCPGLRTAADAAIAALDPKKRKKKVARVHRSPPVEAQPPPPADPEATTPPAEEPAGARHTVSEKLDRLRPPEL